MKVACPGKDTLYEMPDELRSLWDKGEHIIVQPGAYILKQCHSNSQIFWLEEGRVKVSVFLPGGTEKTLCILEPGNILGEVSAFNRHAYPVSVVALQHSILRVFPIDLVHSMIRKHPWIATQLMASISKKLCILATQVESLSTATSQERVADLFIHFVQVYGETTERGIRISLRLTQQELANLAGTSRVSVSNSFRYFKSLGYVTKYRGRYYVLDLDGLQQEASGTGDTTRLEDESLVPVSEAGS